MILPMVETIPDPPPTKKVDRELNLARARRLREIRELAGRVFIRADGSILIRRFRQDEILEHLVLILSVAILALTGLLLAFAPAPFIFQINALLAGAATVRAVHLFAAGFFCLIAAYHFFRIIYQWFVKREAGAMMPRFHDLSDFLRMLYYNLGANKTRPEFDRFSVEEKIGYWGMLIFGVVIGLTGLIQWFSTLATMLLPLEVILMARAIHSQIALPALGMYLIWHLYHTRVKASNASIFSGWMTEEAMQEFHPLEYRRIMAAYEDFKNLDQPPMLQNYTRAAGREKAIESEVPSTG
jgi:formate dehydrogenase subunit gamma